MMSAHGVVEIKLKIDNSYNTSQNENMAIKKKKGRYFFPLAL